MATQWIRKYRLHVWVPHHSEALRYWTFEGEPSNFYKGHIYTGTRIWANEVLISDPIRCTFSCKKTILRDSSIGTITLWNLSPELESVILSDGTKVVLEAGYESDTVAVIFAGTIIQPIRGKENGTDYFLKLICLDGDSYFNLAFSSGTLESNQTKRELAKQTLRLSNYDELNSTGNEIVMESLDNIPEESAVDGSVVKNERPKVIFGKTSKIIDDLARTSNSTVYMDNGELKFFNPSSEDKYAYVWEVNPQTGMIGDPKQSDYQVFVTTLLNPKIRLGDFIHLENTSIVVQELGLTSLPFLLEPSGNYQVIEITYTGDNRGQEWYSKIKAISKNGVIPSQLSDRWGNLSV